MRPLPKRGRSARSPSLGLFPIPDRTGPPDVSGGPVRLMQETRSFPSGERRRRGGSRWSGQVCVGCVGCVGHAGQVWRNYAPDAWRLWPRRGGRARERALRWGEVLKARKFHSCGGKKRAGMCARFPTGGGRTAVFPFPDFSPVQNRKRGCRMCPTAPLRLMNDDSYFFFPFWGTEVKGAAGSLSALVRLGSR